MSGSKSSWNVFQEFFAARGENNAAREKYILTCLFYVHICPHGFHKDLASSASCRIQRIFSPLLCSECCFLFASVRCNRVTWGNNWSHQKEAESLLRNGSENKCGNKRWMDNEMFWEIFFPCPSQWWTRGMSRVKNKKKKWKGRAFHCLLLASHLHDQMCLYTGLCVQPTFQLVYESSARTLKIVDTARVKLQSICMDNLWNAIVRRRLLKRDTETDANWLF